MHLSQLRSVPVVHGDPAAVRAVGIDVASDAMFNVVDGAINVAQDDDLIAGKALLAQIACPACEARADEGDVVVQAKRGKWRCRRCRTAGTLLIDTETRVIRMTTTERLASPPEKASTSMQPVSHLTAAERLRAGVLTDRRGVQLTADELARRLRGQRQAEEIKRATRRLDRAKR